jgi:hypothetical protein
MIPILELDLSIMLEEIMNPAQLAEEDRDGKSFL